MDQKQRFFIYDRKEMGVLLLLGVMVAVFAFTLGVHLGKKAGPKTESPASHGEAHTEPEPETVATVPDKAPNRQELHEQGRGAQQAADESLNQALRDEVGRTGIRLETPRQVQLPEKPRSENAGATTGAGPVPAMPQAPEPAEHGSSASSHEAPSAPREAAPQAHAEGEIAALRRRAPEGRFTLQIGAFPTLDEARDQAESLEALGLKPLLREAHVKGKRWFRVFVGGFNSREAAEKAGARYVSLHMIEAYVVSKMIDR